jgi:hypothetical protein
VVRVGALDKKIDNFLPSRLDLGIVFQKGRQASSRFPRATRDRGFGIKTGNDSLIAPQAIEIAQNGLANGESLARLTGLSEREAP